MLTLNKIQKRLSVTRKLGLGTTISFQISTNQCRVYYGSDELYTYTHGINIEANFPDGLYPHIEFENVWNHNDLIVTIDSIKCEQLDDFYVPID